jgi:hypothetical protein
MSHWANSDFRVALEGWNEIGVPDDAAIRIERVMLAELLANEGDASSEPRIAALVRDQPILSAALRAVWLSRFDRRAEMSELMISALTQYRTDPWPAPVTMGRAIKKVMFVKSRADLPFIPKWLDVLSKPFAVYVNDLARQNARVAIAWALGGADQACLDVLEPLEPNADWSQGMLEFRLSCYAAHNHPLRARAEVELMEFRENEAEGR